MNPSKCIVLDANILVRGVLGSQVLRMIETYAESVAFYSPDVCFHDAGRHISTLAQQRNFSPAAGFETLDRIACLVRVVDRSLYEEFEATARKRLSRDPSDWPILAASLLLNCPVWSEDQDFYGTGVATWTTHNIKLYLSDL
jgi:predicted nucleic acid-binding protein